MIMIHICYLNSIIIKPNLIKASVVFIYSFPLRAPSQSPAILTQLVPIRVVRWCSEALMGGEHLWVMWCC